MDLGVIISCCMSNPCPGWWEGGQKTNHRTNMDIETRCNDFTLLRNDHLVVCWQGKHTAPHGDERRHEQLSQEESNVLIWTSHERGTNTRVTWVWFLQIHNVLQSQDHPTQKFTRSHWCCLKQTLKKKKKSMTACTLQWRPTQTHTHTHNAWAVQCPHFFPVLLGMSWIRPAFAPDPRPQKNTFSVRPHKRCSQCVSG